MKGVLFYDKNPEKLPNSDDFDCSLLTQPKVEPKPSSIPVICCGAMQFSNSLK